jgi:hypothetical protein
MRYQKSAPSVVMRGMFINAVFDSNYGGLTFAISEKCTNTIADYMFLKEASDGTKSKQKVKNPETGVSYEKYGHTSDSNDYLYISMYNSEYINYQRGDIRNKPVYSVQNNRY